MLSFFALIVSACACLQAVVLLQHLRSVSGSHAQLQPHRSKFIVSFVLCVGACAGMVALLAWHLYLLSVGQVGTPFRTKGLKRHLL